MKETVSALFDGELDAVEMDRVCARLKDEPDLRDAWDSYALIGDALRGTTRGALPRTFSERLAAEPDPEVIGKILLHAAEGPLFPRGDVGHALVLERPELLRPGAADVALVHGLRGDIVFVFHHAADGFLVGFHGRSPAGRDEGREHADGQERRKTPACRISAYGIHR